MKRIIFFALSFTLISAPLVSQEKPKDEAPKIPDNVRADYYKSMAKLLSIRDQLKQAEQVLQTDIKVMQDICGKDYNLTTNQDGDPTCVKKIPPPAAKK